MAFRRKATAVFLPDDPEHLYRHLALTNQGPEALWAHQADVLRAWHERHSDNPDVAIELPTGAGKTLVGGLIGDYRRRTQGERVTYLCPTRQLARQTSKKLSEYGIPNVLLVNRVNQWNSIDRSRYSSADAIAVSVYSHVFNTNPGLGDTQLLLLDDAHAAEGFVASPWSLEINRSTEESAYQDVLSILADAIDPLVHARLVASAPEGRYSSDVYLASPVAVATIAGELEAVLTSASGGNKISDSAKYALRLLQGHIDQCMVYASYARLLIRPLIPPTMSHPAFNDPARRVYMSATLGAGGELERTFGRRRVSRIPIPKGWEKQGTGRRLFCIPELTQDLSADPSLIRPWVADLVGSYDRAIVLTPDSRTAKVISDGWLPEGEIVLHATDVEDTLETFTLATSTALVLNNRYDGIDLPDDDCRLVILAGLPARGDLQERFLYGTLGAMEVLQERIRARIVQGAGRATRNTRDYAAVIVLGSDLISYVVRRDVQEAMHPEIHAELEFGYQQSVGITSAEMLDQLRIFNEHGKEWREVDTDVVAARDTYSRQDPAGTEELQRAVIHEVAAYEALWQGELSRALANVREVIDALRGGRAPQRYAALWNYLASCIAQRIANQTGDESFVATARSFNDAARSAGRGTLWLSHLASPMENATSSPAGAVDRLDDKAMQGVIVNARQLAKPAQFEAIVQSTRAGLAQSESGPYEAALVTLGLFAGAAHSEGDGGNDSAPDAVWVFDEILWVAWEAKSGAEPEGELGSVDTRQAGGHLRFAATARGESAPDDSPVFLMTPQARIHPSARAVAESHVYLLRPDTVIDLFERLVRSWRTARSRGIEALTPAELAAIFEAEGALPTQWLATLRQSPLMREAPEEPTKA